MKVEVFSMMAAIAGGNPGTTWRGDLPIGYSGHDGHTLEVIHRFLNRVEESDSDRLSEIGYQLPSLSVGDYVTLHFDTRKPETWRVVGHGFEKITGNQNVIMEVFK